MICAGCGCVFCPDGLDIPPGVPLVKMYCDRRCKIAANRKRARRRDGGPAGACQRHGKMRYPDEASAMADLGRINAAAGLSLTRAYPCGDHWHLTSKTPGQLGPWRKPVPDRSKKEQAST